MRKLTLNIGKIRWNADICRRKNSHANFLWLRMIRTVNNFLKAQWFFFNFHQMLSKQIAFIWNYKILGSLNWFQKEKITCNMIKPPAYYYSGTRLGQIHHTRLRLNCSSLYQHLFLKNTTDNPHCECGAVEDTKHFFLTCYRFRNLRQDLLNKISTFCQPTLDVILYGNIDLSVRENKQIFLAVQDFILKSKRF